LFNFFKPPLITVNKKNDPKKGKMTTTKMTPVCT